jgi:hypothetical protein
MKNRIYILLFILFLGFECKEAEEPKKKLPPGDIYSSLPLQYKIFSKEQIDALALAKTEEELYQIFPKGPNNRYTFQTPLEIPLFGKQVKFNRVVSFLSSKKYDIKEPGVWKYGNTELLAIYVYLLDGKISEYAIRHHIEMSDTSSGRDGPYRKFPGKNQNDEISLFPHGRDVIMCYDVENNMVPDWTSREPICKIYAKD